MIIRVIPDARDPFFPTLQADAITSLQAELSLEDLQDVMNKTGWSERQTDHFFIYGINLNPSHHLYYVDWSGSLGMLVTV